MISSQRQTLADGSNANVIFDDADYLDIEDGPVLFEINKAFFWNRDGRVRSIPTSVLENLRQRYDDAKKAVMAGLRPDIPAYDRLLFWDQCEELPEVNLACQPLPKGTNRDGDNGGVSPPTQQSLHLTALKSLDAALKCLNDLRKTLLRIRNGL